MTEWYYADRQGQQRGPVQAHELLALRAAGQIAMETLVWRDGMANWQTMAAVANELQPSAQAASPMQGGSMYEMAAPAAADASVAAQHTDPYSAPRAAIIGSTLPIHGEHIIDAGFWKRTAAYLLDGMLLGIAGYAVQLPLLLLAGLGPWSSSPTLGSDFGPVVILMILAAYLLPIGIQAVYYAWFHSSQRQATLGKLAIGIKVVGMDGGRITFARGIGRYFGFLLSGFTLGIGYLLAAFTDRKQALHDMIASTFVVDRWAYTEHADWQDPTLGTVTKIILGIFGALIVLAVLAMCAAIGTAILSHS